MKESNLYIIAELSANHNNDFNLAVKTIEAMAKAGADAVKVQTYTADAMTIDVKDEDNPYFKPKESGLWKGYRLYDLYTEASMPYEWQPKLQKITEDLGMEFFSSPFDIKGVDFLETLNVPKYKIASFEITDIPLIKHAASKKKPMIISTGLAEIEDIELAVQACREVGNDDITLLKCTSQYPATVEDANLLTIPDLEQRFKVKVGVSDHTMGSIVPIVAVSLGAKVIEKHFILDRSLGGADSAFSMEPEEFAEMVKAVREAEKALGEVVYEVTEPNKLRRRSLFVVKDIKQGEIFTEEHIRSIRPGHGLAPKYYEIVLGQKAMQDIKRGEPLKEEHFSS
ncbi:pseudaminic acid synthase [Salinimicrobium sediminilitoris]|uniref:pseudaminic acid synthase n=1 Tax=Salinimicrobium sediminilitoris TaxID=2876715 RepID=UPI001E650B80|nr:pseudaminic acid synthase [Salinimicrobium sediminilitoris]MCC8358750.1 pseudaminic acid synthase [Salinimicrobium sediminilitoris]